MERLLNFKVVYSTLAGTNGRVSMDILDQYVHTVNTSLPKDCLLYWKAAASQDGFLTFDGFLRGFQESLKADSRFVEEAFKEKGKGMVEGICTTEELEGVLMQCNQKKLASALTKSRRDLYSSQKSEAGSRKGGDGQASSTSSSSHHHDMIPRVTITKQPLKENEVLMRVEQMLRNRKNDDRFVSEVMGQLTSVLGSRQPSEPLVIPTSHPYATIRRSKSVKEEKSDKSLSRSHPRLLQIPIDAESERSVKLMRSTSFPGKKSAEKRSKSTKRHHEESLPAYTPTSQSKSMHNLDSVSTKDKLYGWMEGQLTSSPMKSSGPPPRRTNSQQVYYQQQPPQHSAIQHSHSLVQSPNKFVSAPDMTNYPLIGGTRPMTQKEMMQAEQYATLRSRDKHSRKKDHQKSGGKNECKTLKSDYIVEIHRLKSEKEALIQQLFEQQASSSKDDSLMSVL